MKFDIPKGKFSSGDANAGKRKKLLESLRSGEEVRVKSDGSIQQKGDADKDHDAVKIPKGKLAFHWYEDDVALYEGEVAGMNQLFPQFTEGRTENGNMYWHGKINSPSGEGSVWELILIYDNNHPNNDSWGGSIKVYSIKPDIADIVDKLGESVPHLLSDSEGNYYLCTARHEDVKDGDVVTTAVSSLAWGVKWIAAFELWLAGDLSTKEFSGHTI